ncbi:hypothetical protein [Thermogemmatispora carboxidivorans]|uniref:hypothetical protein n=1 Tax=Thermogemmatispora carboxidivorans TaxID=1382306 RepID=UPI001EE34360|nr:hypothetical protein [Thermogemmatispora carboxidivorans]
MIEEASHQNRLALEEKNRGISYSSLMDKRIDSLTGARKKERSDPYEAGQAPV